MVFVAQGTVQVKQGEGGQFTAWFNPICDYQVRHNGKKYTVLVGNDQNYRIQPTEKSFEAPDSV